jgi:hypothetical protein
MGLDQPRYVVVNGWPEGSHLNEVMATRGGVCVGTCEAVPRMISSRIRPS